MKERSHKTVEDSYVTTMDSRGRIYMPQWFCERVGFTTDKRAVVNYSKGNGAHITFEPKSSKKPKTDTTND
jgi:hypothetical protein